jgi:hypothetical protein
MQAFARFTDECACLGIFLCGGQFDLDVVKNVLKQINFLSIILRVYIDGKNVFLVNTIVIARKTY